MPIYEFKCKKCNNIFEFFKLKQNDLITCSYCGNTNIKDMEKIIKSVAVFFKGEGWTSKNYNESIDPTSVSGVKKIENPSKNEKILYKKKKIFTGKKRKIKI